MTKDSISLRATIFPDECPELYEQLERMLPAQKFRRRFVLIEILRRGCQAIEQGLLEPSGAGNTRANLQMTSPRVERQSAAPERASAVVSEAPVAGESQPEVELEMADLDHLFGGG